MRKKILSIFILFFIITASSISAYEWTKKTINWTENGKTEEVRTHADTVREVLGYKGIKIDKYDRVTPELDTKLENGMNIEYQKAKNVTLKDDGVVRTYRTAAKTIKEFFAEAGIDVRKEDLINPDVTSGIKNGMEATVTRAIPYKIDDGGNVISFYSTKKESNELFSEKGILLRKWDKVKRIGNEITITRIVKKERKEIHAVGFKSMTKKDVTLKKGEVKILQKGSKGMREDTYEVLFENGKETKKTLLKQIVIQEAKNEIVAVGTKVIRRQVSRGSNPSREFTVTATAYTASCVKCSGITATGINLKKNSHMKVISVDPTIIPLGTKVWVEGYGYAIAADTGSHIKGNRIDLFMPNKSDALAWGKRSVIIKTLK